jgi:hypothetical protein
LEAIHQDFLNNPLFIYLFIGIHSFLFPLNSHAFPPFNSFFFNFYQCRRLSGPVAAELDWSVAAIARTNPFSTSSIFG